MGIDRAKRGAEIRAVQTAVRKQRLAELLIGIDWNVFVYEILFGIVRWMFLRIFFARKVRVVACWTQSLTVELTRGGGALSPFVGKVIAVVRSRLE